LYAVADTRSIAPEGWHVPTDEEWQELVDYLGGSDVAGGILKATGTIEDGDGLWYSPNEGATNASGFSALPGGYRSRYDGTFNGIGDSANFWSSPEYDGSREWYSRLFCSSSVIGRNNPNSRHGFSVRCIRD
jgi:uncharacterized protein (TIGR02145 family)